ncbi:hypothetical protein [Devosia ginsengisoli]|uniref:Transferrin-binding protein-like solute binding protein n=1 Tax=Devosia ginsengisoli TaxID=400770 RepID=A0A5B8LTE3_9HYPH|nr:hypothetical protein [Devosia ginsengisoli]QDZ10924.1 hypothetical protein FPZ08_09275 [Devosia ginsengisoli]
MTYWGKGSHVLMAAAGFLLVAVPVQAQSTFSGIKDVLASKPPESMIKEDMAQLLSTVLGLPPPPASPPTPAPGASPAPSLYGAGGNLNPTTLRLSIQKILADLQASQAQHLASIAAAVKLAEAAKGKFDRETIKPLPVVTDFNETKVPGFALTEALQPHPANKGAATLQAWLKDFTVGNPAYRAGIRPVWGDVLPTVLSGYYTGSAVAVMPGGAASTGDLTLVVDFNTRDVSGAMNFSSANPDLAGDIEFGGTAQIGGSNHAMAGDIWYSGAFGGVIEDGKWSGGFYGSMADIVSGDWRATVDGGPNAGLVHGKFGGQQ